MLSSTLEEKGHQSSTLAGLKSAFAAAALTGISLLLWRLASEYGSWAILSMIPLGCFLLIGSWSLALPPWKAKLRITLRPASRFSRFLTGKLYASGRAIVFTSLSVILLSWQALDASQSQALFILAVLLAAGILSALVENYLARHFHQPFAREYSAFATTWIVAVPFFLFMAFGVWASEAQDGDFLNASFYDAIRLGIARNPVPDGWLSSILNIAYAFEAMKLWAVVQARDFALVAVAFSLDAALISFVVARSGVVLAILFRTSHLFGRK